MTYNSITDFFKFLQMFTFNVGRSFWSWHWLRFFCAFSSVVRWMPGYNSPSRGTARTIPKFLYCSFVLFYVLFVCKCVFYNCHRVATHLQSTNIYHIINGLCCPHFRETWCLQIQLHSEYNWLAFSQIQYTGRCDLPIHRGRQKPVLSLNQYDHNIATGDGSVELIRSSGTSNIGYISGTSCGPGFMRIEQVTVACSRYLAWFAPKTSTLSDSPMTQ